MSKSVQRINEYIDYKDLTKKEVEVKIGMSNGSLSSQIKNRKSIGSDKLENFLLSYPEVSAEWLLRGEGEMIRNEDPSGTTEELLNAYRKINRLEEELQDFKSKKATG